MSSAAPSRQALRHLRRLCTTTATDPIALTVNRQPPGVSRGSCSILSPVAGRRSQRPFSTARALLQETQQSSPTPASTTSSASAPNAHTHSNDEHDTPIPDVSTYYTLFPSTLSCGPPPQGPFHIPLGQLKREFLQLQAQHHPDKYHHSHAAHRTARGMSSLLNTAYKTLSDPLLRARYLLHHKYGVDITSEDNNTHRSLTDQETLMEVLEAQEAIEEATTQDQIDALKEENKARIKEAERLLGRAFEKEDIDLAKKECIRLNYWRSLQQGLHDWEPGKEVRLIH